MNVDWDALIQRRPPLDDPRWGTAYHEAGHAIMCCALGLAVERVSVKKSDDGKQFGHMLHEPWSNIIGTFPNRPVRFFWRRSLMVTIAGELADQLASSAGGAWPSEIPPEYVSADEMEVRRMLSRLAPTQEKQIALAKRLRREVLKTLRQHWNAVNLLAHLLLIFGEVQGPSMQWVVENTRSAGL